MKNRKSSKSRTRKASSTSSCGIQYDNESQTFTSNRSRFFDFYAVPEMTNDTSKYELKRRNSTEEKVGVEKKPFKCQQEVIVNFVTSTESKCKNKKCKCNPCPEPSKSEVAIETCKCSSSVPCDCIQCKCSPCSDPNKKVTAESNKAKKQCKCGKCVDGKCPKSNSSSRIAQTPSSGIAQTPLKTQTGATKARGDQTCSCIMGCVCINCKFKPDSKTTIELTPCDGTNICKCIKCKCAIEPKSEKIAETVTFDKDKPAGRCNCGNNCFCKACEFSKGDGSYKYLFTDYFGKKTIPVKSLTVSAYVCKCETDKQKSETKGKGTNECTCPECKCSPCSDPSKGAKGGSKGFDPCNCETCKCDPCSDPSKGGKGGSQGGNQCNCQTCKCSPCKDPTKKSAGGSKAKCNCDPCNCKECEFKKAETPKGGSKGGSKQGCQCLEKSDVPPCTCKDCENPDCSSKNKKGGGTSSRPSSGNRPSSKPSSRPTSGNKANNDCNGGKSSRPTSAAKTSRPTSAAKTSRPTSASRPSSGTKGSGLCRCGSKSKTKDDSGAGGGSVTITCNCNPCACAVCMYKGKESAGGAGGGKESGGAECNCKSCACPVCTKKGGAGGGKDSAGGAECNCKSCACPVCTRKGGAGGGKGSAECNCKTCTCPGKEFDGGAECNCKECKCPVCSKKGGAGGAGGGKESAGGAECTCKSCACPVCTKKGGAGGGKDSAGGAECNCKECTCPVCTKKGGAGGKGAEGGKESGGGAECNCQTCTCPICTRKKDKGGAKGAGGAGGGKESSDGGCKCDKRAGGGGGGGGGGSKTTLDCNCQPSCACAVCTKKPGGLKGGAPDGKLSSPPPQPCKSPSDRKHGSGGEGGGFGGAASLKCPSCTIKPDLGGERSTKFPCKSPYPSHCPRTKKGVDATTQLEEVSKDNDKTYFYGPCSKKPEGGIQNGTPVGDILASTCLQCFTKKAHNRAENKECTLCTRMEELIMLTDNYISEKHAIGDASNCTNTKKENGDEMQLASKNITRCSLINISERFRDVAVCTHSCLLPIPDLNIMYLWQLLNSKEKEETVKLYLMADKNKLHHKKHKHKRLKNDNLNMSEVPPFEIPKKIACNPNNCNCIICSKKRVETVGYVESAPMLNSILKTGSEMRKISVSKCTKTDFPIEACKDNLSDSFEHSLKKTAIPKCAPKNPNSILISFNSQASQDVSEKQILRPMIKVAPEFCLTMSNLMIAYDCLEKKGKAKDQLIESLSKTLKSLGGNATCDCLMNCPAIGSAPDYDRSEDLTFLEMCNGKIRDNEKIRNCHLLSTSPGTNKVSPKSRDDFLPKEMSQYRSSECVSDSYNNKMTYFVKCSHAPPISKDRKEEINSAIEDWNNNKKENTSVLSNSSAFGSLENQTESRIQLAINHLKQKCKDKDTLIVAAALDLKKSVSNSTLLNVLRGIPGALEHRIITEIINTDSVDKESRHRKKMHGTVPCKSDKIHKDNIRVDLQGFEVISITRIMFNSLIVKWLPPKSTAIIGYEILVNGKKQVRIMSRIRTSSMIHSVDLSNPVFIDVYAITDCGRCEPPATAVFELLRKCKSE